MKTNLRILFALSLMLAGLGTTMKPAQLITQVTLCDTDTQIGNGLNLNTAIASGGVIRFDCGGPKTILVTQTHEISGQVDIRGDNQIALQAATDTPLFQVNGSNASLTLVNIVIAGGNVGIRNTGGAVTLAGVSFNSTSAAVQNEARGQVRVENGVFRASGLMNGDGKIEIRHNTAFFVTNSFAIRNAISTGEVFIEDSQFSPAGDPAGGPPIGGPSPAPAIVNQGIMTIRKSEFDNLTTNSANSGGGAISNFGQLTVERTEFRRNRAIGGSHSDGGAISSGANSSRLVVRDSLFYSNSTGGCGGAISISHWPDSQTEISGSRFERNVALCGGALFAESAANGLQAVAVVQSNFIQNTASEGGGAIAIGGQDHFKSNNGVLNLRNVVIANNTARQGGGLYLENAQLAVVSSAIISNSAAGGGALVFWDAADHTAKIANTIIVRNAGQEAGGILIFGAQSNFRLMNSTLVDNAAGGMEIWDAPQPGPQVHLVNTIIAHNADWNCRGTGFVDDGHNLQFPGTTCASGIVSKEPYLDAKYAPAIISPAYDSGDDAVCTATPINSVDLFGEKRPHYTHCTIGAVEKPPTPPVAVK
jgi:hypothetical protein